MPALPCIRFVFSRRRRLVAVLGLGLAAAGAFIALANHHVVSANAPRLYADLAALPACDVALVLGANATLADGRANPHFTARMDAAAALYHAGKVRHLLVSGDNHTVTYDEPAMMRDALVARGVPADAITCDYAGFRTLDSVVRAREIFGLRECVIVSQRYHNSRALEIARARGLDAVGFCAADVPARFAFRAEAREILARAATVLDLYVWHREPRFLGRAEPIQVARR